MAATLRDLRRAGAGAVVGILLSGLAAAVTGGTRLGLEALTRLEAAWRTDLRIVAILRDSRDGAGGSSEAQRVVATVRALPGVGAVRYISAKEALVDLRRALGGAGDGLDRLPANPLPARLEIAPLGTLAAAELRDLVATLGRVAGVEEVQAAFGWVGSAERIGHGLRVAGLGLGGLLGLAAVLAVAGATATARRRRAEETAVLRQVGVGEGRIRGPLLLQSIAQGGLGAGLGVGGLFLVSEAGPAWVARWLAAVAEWGLLPAAPPPLVAVLLGSGLVVGLLGGLLGGRP